MKEFLFISIILCNFAKWIGGSHEPLTRVIQQPFHVCNCWNYLIVGNMKRLTQEEFIARARKVHGDKYDYSLVEYKNNTTKICIVCPEHGKFFQTPKNHLRGSGCHKCGNWCKDTLDTFVEKANLVHNNKYDYSNVIYTNSQTKVEILCPIHGIFRQIPASHLHGHGCPKCKDEETSKRFCKTNNDYIKQATIVHNGKYSYEKTEYKGAGTQICVICPIHGDFWQNASNHLNGAGCPRCQKSFGEMKVKSFLDNNHIEYIEQYKINNENLFCSNKIIKVDFYLPKHNAIVEYQGVQHYVPVKRFGGKDSFEIQIERDFAVKQYCYRHKIRLIEISYTEKKNIDLVLKKELKIK